MSSLPNTSFDDIRKRMISIMGYKNWYTLLELEDAHDQKFLPLEKCVKEIQTLIMINNAENIRAELLDFRNKELTINQKIRLGQSENITMSYKIEQIVLENEKGFVIEVSKDSYEMYEIGVTHSTRCGRFSQTTVAKIKKNWFVPKFGEPTITDKSEK